MSIPLGDYTHSKTGNIYTVGGVVFPSPTPRDPHDILTTLTAFCCENKEVKVQVYQEGVQYFYVTDENENLHENTALKVLYHRDGVNWLRTLSDYIRPVEINGKVLPRFEKIS